MTSRFRRDELWLATLDEVAATLAGKPLPAPRFSRENAEAFENCWANAMDDLLGERGVDDVSPDEWAVMAADADDVALTTLRG